jgi:tetratricopeptide (TPR) repeat protein
MRIGKPCLGLALLWAGGAGALWAQGLDRSAAVSMAHAGTSLTEAQAQALEARLEAQPDDLDTRTQLLGYYFRRAHESREARRAKQAHVQWLIRNRPEAAIAGGPEARLNSAIDGEAYFEAKRLWLDQAKALDKDPRVLGNAAAFVQLEDDEKAEQLWKQAQQVEPSNDDWPGDLGRLYKRRIYGLKAEARRPLAAVALQHFERALEVTDSRASILTDAAEVAVDAGETEKARAFALELLATPAGHWSHGNAVHHGNLVLGRLALQSGNVAEAGQYLLKAGETPGSPNLNSFGPNMTLARELLEEGEREVVLDYFQLCSGFWKSDRGRLDNWAATVLGGGTPDFRANLIY